MTPKETNLSNDEAYLSRLYMLTKHLPSYSDAYGNGSNWGGWLSLLALSPAQLDQLNGLSVSDAAAQRATMQQDNRDAVAVTFLGECIKAKLYADPAANSAAFIDDLYV